jgi:MOSC domain-containing protein YiiM
MPAKVLAVSISTTRGVRKENVEEGVLESGFGIQGDAHGGDWHRQVSLLASESIEKMRKVGLDVGPGDFAENLTTEGIDLVALPLGTRLRIGGGVLLELTQKGKVCHERCAIFYQAGDCVMPREGIFARIVKGGVIRPGDAIEVVRVE